MADLLSSENRRRRKKETKNSPDNVPTVKKTQTETPEAREDIKSQLCVVFSKKCPGKPKKEVRPVNGSPRKLWKLHERSECVISSVFLC